MSLYFRVLSTGLLQNGDFGVSLIQKHQEILVGQFSVGLISRQCERSAQLQVRKCSYGIAPHNSAMFKNFLKFHSRFRPLM
jgi:hypothetical protein